MKKMIKRTKPILVLLTTVVPLFAPIMTHAIPRITPQRCAHDSLNQWSEGQALQGTSRGRNEWLKTCNKAIYRTVFPGGIEFDAAEKSRRAYPTYGVVTGADSTGQVVFNHKGYVAPTTPVDTAADPSCNLPSEDMEIVGLCVSGCVSGDSLVTTANGADLEIQELKNQQELGVMVPVLEGKKAHLKGHKISRHTSDIISANQDVIVLTMKSGKKLILSLTHPMVDGNGEMKKARDFKAGDELMTEKGNAEEILKVNAEKHFGKLHNLVVKTNKLSESLFVVNGYVSGDKKFQDQEVLMENRRFLRSVAGKTQY